MRCDFKQTENGAQCQECGKAQVAVEDSECPAEITAAGILKMRAGEIPARAVAILPFQRLQMAGDSLLTPEETQALFSSEDKSLIGNRVKSLLAAIGVPPCGGCDSRAEWMNRAHLWLRELSRG